MIVRVEAREGMCKVPFVVPRRLLVRDCIGLGLSHEGHPEGWNVWDLAWVLADLEGARWSVWLQCTFGLLAFLRFLGFLRFLTLPLLNRWLTS